MSLPDWLQDDAEQVAPRLLGCKLHVIRGGEELSGIIVETEAYDQTDAASHTYRGQTPRNSSMFGPAGRLYVYFTYGMHFCCNVVAGKDGFGSGVLIRAIEPVAGLEYMKRRRGGRSGHELTNGPGKTCQALGINREDNGHDLSRPPILLEASQPLENSQIVRTTRIGISNDKHRPWRFYIKDNPYVSRP